jgi:hypothetical protein
MRSIKRAFSEEGEEDANEMPEIPSSIPFLPHVVSFKTLIRLSYFS